MTYLLLPTQIDSQQFGGLCPGLAPRKHMKYLVESRGGRVGAASEGAGLCLDIRRHTAVDLWRLANVDTVWDDLFNRHVCGFA